MRPVAGHQFRRCSTPLAGTTRPSPRSASTFGTPPPWCSFRATHCPTGKSFSHSLIRRRSQSMRCCCTVEDDRWLALIARHGFGPRIGTWDSFLAASHSLVTPTLHNTLRHATPIGGIRHYGLAASYWKHFERLPCLPRG